MHRIRNVLTQGVLINSLSGPGTWLPVRLAVTYVYTPPSAFSCRVLALV